MDDVVINIKVSANSSEIEQNVQNPLQKAVSEFEKSLNNATSNTLNNVSSTFSNSNTGNNQVGGLNLDVLENLLGSGTAATSTAIGTVIGGAKGALVGLAIGLILDQANQALVEQLEQESQIDFSKSGLSVGELFNDTIRKKFVEQLNQTIFGFSNIELGQLVIDTEEILGKNLNFEDVLEVIPDVGQFFKPERIQQVNEAVVKLKDNQKIAQEIAEKFNQTGSETNQISQEQAIIYKENAEVSLEVANNQSTLAEANKAVAENFKEQTGQVEQAEKTLGDFGRTAGDAGIDTEQLAGSAEDLADNMKDSKKQIDRAEKTLDNLGGATKAAGDNLERADTAAQQLGQNGLPKIKEGAETAGQGIVKASEEGKKGLTSLGMFAGREYEEEFLLAA